MYVRGDTGAVCDARFSKCCGGRTEAYRAAWDDRDVPYLRPLYDGPDPAPSFEAESWIGGDPPTWHPGEGTDFEAVQNGFVSITPLHLDLTHHDSISRLKPLEGLLDRISKRA